MPAFFVASVTIKDADKFTEYAQKAGATFAAYGGEIVLRGRAEAALAGALTHSSVGVVQEDQPESIGRAISDWLRRN